MDANSLRLLLLITGISLIAGIYLADYFRRVHEARKKQSLDDQANPGFSKKEPLWESVKAENSTGDDETAIPERELKQFEKLLDSDNELAQEPNLEQGDQFVFPFTDEDGSEEGSHIKIIQLNIVSKKDEFFGHEIAQACKEVNLTYGKMGIYHRLEEINDRPRSLFSLANMLEPGTFPNRSEGLEQFTTHGLTIFAQLPGPKDGLTLFSEMLYAAEQLAIRLDGELQDETRSDLSRQTIEHLRAEIQEYHRQLQLARNRR